MKVSDIYGPLDVFPFGKYKGRKVADVYEQDPEYLGWCIEQEIDFVIDNLNPEALENCQWAYREQDEEGCFEWEILFGED